MRTYLRLILLGILIALLAGCSGGAATEEAQAGVDMTVPEVAPVELGAGEKLSVVATTSIVGDVVSQVGGDVIDLVTLMDVGQDPHSFEPTPQDLAQIERADLVFINGLGLEEVLLASIENVASGVIVPVSAGIEPLAFEGSEQEEDHADADLEGEGQEHAGGDPHFWVDPNNVMVWTQNVAQVLAAADPAHADDYTANADAYLAQLGDLDAYIRDQVARIPQEDRLLVTDHETLGYFADEYGFEIVGAIIPTSSTTAGASAGDVASLVEIVRERAVPAIFVGTTAGQGLQALAQTVADETGQPIRVLPLLSGSLAPSGQPGDTYLGYMRYNVDQIVEGLASR